MSASMTTWFDKLKDDFKWNLSRFKKTIPGDLVKTIVTDGGAELDYISWPTATDIADDVFPKWSVEIGQVLIGKTKVVLTTKVTVAGVVRENIASVSFEKKDPVEMDEPFAAVYAKALKRTLALFGIGRYLYKAPDYKPHQLATIESTYQVVSLIDDGKVDVKYVSQLQNLIMNGELTEQRAQQAITKFSTVPPESEDTPEVDLEEKASKTKRKRKTKKVPSTDLPVKKEVVAEAS